MSALGQKQTSGNSFAMSAKRQDRTFVGAAPSRVFAPVHGPRKYSTRAASNNCGCC